MKQKHNNTIADLNTLEEQIERLEERIHFGERLDDEIYLQIVAIHVLIISKLEFFLKMRFSKERLPYNEIIEKIKESSLDVLEKDHLILLVLIRHTLVHNGGYADKKFLGDCKKKLEKLEMKNYEESSLTVLGPSQLKKDISIVKKIVQAYNMKISKD